MNSRTRLRTVAPAVVTATAAGMLSATAAPASAAVSCTSPVFKRQFFANTTFSGTPKKTDCDSAISQSWGTGAPASGLPSNNFSVRWSVTRDFGSGGPFTLSAETQDGIRVYLDGVRKIDLWKNVSTTQKKSVNLTIPSGKHTLRIDYVNWTGSANVKFTYTPRTSADVDKVKPLAPAGAAVSYTASTGAAKVSWSKNVEMDLAGYRVYRRLQNTSTWTKVATTTATAYTDTPPATGKLYYYEVRAYDKAGNVSAGSADRGVTTVDKTPPAAPFVEMDACPDDQPYAAPELVTTAANAAEIAWYEAQRLNPATGTWTTVHSGAKGAFCDTGHPADGSKVTYRGRARDAAGNWSVYSAATTFTTSDLTPPATAADAHVEYRSGVPHLVWSPVAGAASYQVLQYDPTTGGYLDGLTDGAATTQTDVVPRQQLAIADTYRYAVRAVDAKGNASAPVEITLSMADRTEAIPVHRITASSYGKGVTLAWSGVDPWTLDDDTVPKYRIIRTDTATGSSTTLDLCSPYTSEGGPLQAPSTYTTWAGSDDPAYAAGGKTANSTCLDLSGESETTYEYRIVTVDPYGNLSQPSGPATATTPDTRRPAPVQDLTAEQIPFGVRLTWTPPADDDVQGYYVWQGTSDPDTGETVWKKNCWTGTSLAETEILCPTLPDGREHVYRVAATDAERSGDGIEEFNPAEITVTLPDSRPPGWTGTTVTEGQYPSIYLGCADNSSTPCGTYTDYRVERWDAIAGAYTTVRTGAIGSSNQYMDTTVYEDRLGLYYYRLVFTDASGAEQTVRSAAYGIWDSWL